MKEKTGRNEKKKNRVSGRVDNETETVYKHSDNGCLPSLSLLVFLLCVLTALPFVI